MDEISLYEFFYYRIHEVLAALLKHIQITGMAVGLAILIGVPFGVLITRKRNIADLVINIANILQTLPSLALFGLIIPFLGIGLAPAVFVLFLYALLPIIKNTYIGITQVDSAIIEAGVGMGMTPNQVLTIIEIPLALPVIMGGIRVSTVINIGTATIAAFIGAGGLGDFIFRGLSMNNNNMILMGAIPAALLAISIDFVFGKIEKLLMPRGNEKNKKNHLKIKRLMIVLLSGLLLTISLFSIFEFGNKNKTIVIGHKNYTEQRILGQMLSIIIEKNTNYKTELKEFGGTMLANEALKSGNIDCMVEYTGTGYLYLLKGEGLTDPQKIYEFCVSEFAKQGITWLNSFGYNNTFAFVVKKELAKKYGLETYSDLIGVAKKLKIGETADFFSRADGMIGITKTYGFSFKEEVSIDIGLKYIALEKGKIDVGVAYTTDGLLKKYGLKILRDDKNFFPAYNAVPIIRSDFAKSNPTILEVLKKFNNNFTEEDFQNYNYQVDVLGSSEKNVAEAALKSKGLI